MTDIDRSAYREQYKRHLGTMEAMLTKAKSEKRSFTVGEAAEFDRLDRVLGELGKHTGDSRSGTDAFDTHGVPTGRANPAVEGRTNEAVKVGDVRTWYNRAVDNDLSFTAGTRESGYAPVSLRSQGTDRDLNRFWGERFGIARPSMESRSLLEDTSGSALAITPQSWVADYVDVLLPNTILGKTGAQVVPMSTEYVNVPVFTSTVSPQWIAEAGSISLDGNPAFAPLQLSAMGGFKDITLFSIEAAQDAYIRGNLDGMLTQAVAKKMAVVLDTSMLMGISGNAGVPGLVNESGFVTRHYTGDSGTTGTAPTDTTELSVVAEIIRNKNVEPTAIVSNPSLYGTYQRIKASSGTYPMYWPRPADVMNIPWAYSANSALPTTETDPATASSVAQTGGSYSSFYMGDWSRFCYVGIHLDLQTQILRERYADSGEIGLLAYARYSIRFAHPEAFVRTIGVTTS
jgi:HK97 family phage major capsid protein